MDISQGMTRRSLSLLWGMVTRRWYWPMVFSILLAFAGGLFAWHTYAPEYSISITFIPARYLIDLNGDAILTGNGFNDAITRSFTYSQLVKDEQIRDAVRKAVDFPITKEEFDKAVSTSVDENSAAITINIAWKDEKEAHQISRALKAQLNYVIAHLADVGIIKWVDGYSTELKEPGMSRNMKSGVFFALGCIGGLGLGVCFSIFIGVFDKRIFNLEYVQYGADIDIAGIINRPNKILGLLEKYKLLKNPDDKNLLNQPYKQMKFITDYLKNQKASHNKKAILFTAPTRNCGTSALVKEFAGNLSKSNMKVLVLSINKIMRPNIKETVKNHSEIQSETDSLDKYFYYWNDTVGLEIRTKPEGVDEYFYFWNDAVGKAILLEPILKILSDVKENYDFMLIDCPALLENIELTDLAKEMDSTMLVFQYGKTWYDDVLFTISALKKVGVRSLSCLWNQTDERYLRKPYFPQ